MKVLESLTKLLIAWCERTGRVFEITGTGGADDVYLIRYYVFQSRFFNFFIHRFLRSDRDDLHDHPWNFCTYLVKGTYKERRYNPKTGEIDVTVRQNFKCGKNWDDHTMVSHKQNRFVFRKATDQHQVLVYNDLKRHQKEDATLTLCFTGPTIREWGFVKEEPVYSDGTDIAKPGLKVVKVNRHWIYWKTYLGLPEDTPGRG